MGTGGVTLHNRYDIRVLQILTCLVVTHALLGGLIQDHLGSCPRSSSELMTYNHIVAKQAKS
jgi:hypothetical protein